MERKPMDLEGWNSLKPQLVAPFIEERRVLFLRYQNPTHAFAAYRACRVAKIDIPDWVLELLDQWADILSERRPKGAKSIADALGLGKKGGPSVTSQAETQFRNLRIAQRVFELQEEGTLEAAFPVAAEEFNLSPDRISDIWYTLTRLPSP